MIKDYNLQKMVHLHVKNCGLRKTGPI